MITSLVTGGAGFIGSHTALHCLNLGHRVIILDDLSGGFRDHIPFGAEFIEGSVNDLQLLQKIFADYKFDYVFHLAAYAAEGLSHFVRRFNYNNNLIGSVNLINLSIIFKIKCFVFTSSIAVYGAGQLPLTENMVPHPEDPYGIAKYAVEMDLKAANKMFNLNYIIFRPHNVYGENQNIGDKYRNVIGIFMNQILRKKPLTVFGDGQQTRAFSYIDDVAPYIANSVNIKEAYNQVFNIGADHAYTVNELASMVAEEFGKQPEIVHLAARKEVVHAHSSHAKATAIFEMRPGLSLKAGISKMAAWATTVGARASKDFEKIEIQEKLPQGWSSE
ncbi:NAD-dependent epimerase/dehydratase family protein [Mucilaginibacter sp.]|uniref:NAD-dependent epimerase/dehydratase family protein n=1 Tax=Mucilaginibacter sp. TaxID=1882438 RepID=UPI0025E5114A|nr:NAD-dependent epimerase/dehydratase family protein [Mucilaginibacter sp.]